MSKKRNKWKFSPARRQRPVVIKPAPEKTASEEILESAEEAVQPEENEAVVEAMPQKEEADTAVDTRLQTEEAEAAAEEVSQEEAEDAAVDTCLLTKEIEAPAEDAAVDTRLQTEEVEAAAEEVSQEEAEDAAIETLLPTEETEAEVETAAPENEIETVSEEIHQTEVYGEETSAAKELPDYFFDEEDTLPPLSVYERASGGKKSGKKKGAGKKHKDRERDVERRIVEIGSLQLGDGEPKLCVPITGRTKEQILKQAEETAAVSPDLVEWRVDYLEEAGGKKDIVEILVSLRRALGEIPLLFTYRTEGEGGNGRVGWSHYAELLEWAACRPEIDLIDVEAMGLDVDTEGLIRVIHSRGTPVVSSVHYCSDMPDKKERREALRFLKQSGGDIIKIAVMPHCEEEVLELMRWTRKQSKKLEQPLITMAMGEIGKLSRVSGRLTGSAVTFGSVGEASAPGQIPAAELRGILTQL